MKYRAEIDGLRALAVVPVILFHAGFELFSGGFVGVDVFFVISGYLITTILIEDIENKCFSIVNFYERRARRILPALFFVMLVCIPFAWMWMLPSQMKDFSQSLVAVSLFASNILFWRESGYFAAAAEEKPLLHTWSLAVEEQYYVLFPIFLILAWRFGKNRVFWMIVVMAAISLLLGEWGWRNKATANFYLAPTRAWELFAGSIAAIIVQKQGVQKNNLLATCGLAAIIFSIFFYDENTPFPSVYALVPVLGVVLIVLYAEKETIVAKLLSIKGIVGIGLISYSAYLWHQPLFAFARIPSLEHPSLLLMSMLSFTSLVLAYFSWRYIEKPFRGNHAYSRKQIFSFSLLGVGFFIFLGCVGSLKNGFEYRYDEEDLEYLGQINSANSNYVIQRFNELQYSDWNSDKTKLFLVGDSFAQDLTNAIYEAGLNNNYSISTWQIAARCGNVYIRVEEKKEFISGKDFPSCFKTDYFGNVDFIEKLKNADEVWFASSWKPWQAELIKMSIANIEELTTAHIRVFGRKDFPLFKPRKYLGLSGIERANFSEPIPAESVEINQRFLELLDGYDFVDVQSLMCGGNVNECKIFTEAGQIKTYDGGHLTKAGASFYGNSLRTIIGK